MKEILRNIFIIIFLFLFWYISFSLLNIVHAASVSVGSATVTEGQNVTINFNVSGATSGYQGNVSYDTSKLEFISCSFSTSSDLNSYNAGNVASALGNSFSMVFKAKASGTANVSFTNILLGDGSSLPSASGKVTINSAPSQTTNEPTTPEQPTEPAPSQPTTPPVQKEPNFKSVNDTVYATKSMNVRSSWSTSSKKIGGLAKNQAVTRTGIGDNGWSRITYNGKTAYVSTALITTTKPVEEEPEEKPEELENENKVDNNTIDEENIDNENQPEENPEETDLNDEEQIYQEIVSKVGTIPEVGKNNNIYVFLIFSFISLCSIIYILKKI